MKEPMIFCRKCKTYKPLHEFNHSHVYRTGKGECRICLRQTKGVTKFRYKTDYNNFIKYIYSNLVGGCKYKNFPAPNFTLDDFTIWIKNQNYDKLYLDWQQHRFDSYYKPSIDRKNSRENYTLNNMQLITWKENADKQSKEQKWKVGKPVYQLEDGFVIAKYCSILEASRQTKIDASGIARVCKKEYAIAGNYGWSYSNRGWN
jgi:hypothetical protein